MALSLPVEPDSVCAEAGEVQVEEEAKGEDKHERRMVRRFYEILFAGS